MQRDLHKEAAAITAVNVSKQLNSYARYNVPQGLGHHSLSGCDEDVQYHGFGVFWCRASPDCILEGNRIATDRCTDCPFLLTMVSGEYDVRVVSDTIPEAPSTWFSVFTVKASSAVYTDAGLCTLMLLSVTLNNI